MAAVGFHFSNARNGQGSRNALSMALDEIVLRTQEFRSHVDLRSENQTNLPVRPYIQFSRYLAKPRKEGGMGRSDSRKLLDILRQYEADARKALRGLKHDRMLVVQDFLNAKEKEEYESLMARHESLPRKIGITDLRHKSLSLELSHAQGYSAEQRWQLNEFFFRNRGLQNKFKREKAEIEERMGTYERNAKRRMEWREREIEKHSMQLRGLQVLQREITGAARKKSWLSDIGDYVLGIGSRIRGKIEEYAPRIPMPENVYARGALKYGTIGALVVASVLGIKCASEAYGSIRLQTDSGHTQSAGNIPSYSLEAAARVQERMQEKARQAEEAEREKKEGERKRLENTAFETTGTYQVSDHGRIGQNGTLDILVKGGSPPLISGKKARDETTVSAKNLTFARIMVYDAKGNVIRELGPDGKPLAGNYEVCLTTCAFFDKGGGINLKRILEYYGGSRLEVYTVPVVEGNVPSEFNGKQVGGYASFQDKAGTLNFVTGNTRSFTYDSKSDGMNRYGLREGLPQNGARTSMRQHHKRG